MNQRILHLRSLSAVSAIVFCASTGAAGQSTPNPAVQAPRDEVSTAQRNYAAQTPEQKASTKGLIRLNAHGPIEKAFQNFDVPFAVALWYCEDGQQADPRAQTPLTRQERGEKAKRCSRKLEEARTNGEVVKFRYESIDENGEVVPDANIRIRIIGTAPLPAGSTEPDWGRVGVTLGPDRKESEVPLSALHAIGVRGRVDVLVYQEEAVDPKKPDGEKKFVPKTGIALSFDQTPQLPTASYTDVAIPEGSARGAARRARAARTSATAPVASLTPVAAPTHEHQIHVRLDRTGVATPQFLNPRWPVMLGPQASNRPASAATQAPPQGQTPPVGTPPSETLEQWQEDAVLIFVNRVADRQFVVTFSGIGENNRWAFLDAGLRLTSCRAGKCDAVVQVGRGTQSDKGVPVRLLYDAYVKNGRASVVSFDVSLFDEERQLANPKGFFSVVPYELLDEQEGGSTWLATVASDFGFTPDMSDLAPTANDDPAITDTASRGGANEWKVNGSVRLGLTQRLGARARGEFDLRVKSGRFGEGGSPTVTATKYKLNVFAIQGMTFSGGRFDIGAPTESIALSEGGENVGMHYGVFDVNHIFKKNVPELRRAVLGFEEGPSARDHSATLVQVRGLPVFKSKNASLDVYGLFGNKRETRCLASVNRKCPEAPKGADENAGSPPPPEVFELKQRYATVGSEITFGFGDGVTGSAAIYRSELWTRNQPPGSEQLLADRGRGTVSLVTLAWTLFDEEKALDARPVNATLRVQYGLGSGDDPARHDSENDGYLGENAGFAPDVLFLGLIAPAIQTARGQVGAGLSNKQYLGGLFTTPRWSLLGQVAKWMQVPNSDISSHSTTIKLHTYGFRQRVGDRHYAGTEMDTEFAVESPAGLNYSLSIAGFWPGASLRKAVEMMTPGDPAASKQLGPLVRTFQWSIVAGLSVKL